MKKTTSKSAKRSLMPRLDAPVSRPLVAVAAAGEGPAVDACGNVQPSSGYGVLALTMR